MQPRRAGEAGQDDLFRAGLSQIINLDHPLAKLANSIKWNDLEHPLADLYRPGPGQPPLPIRLMIGLSLLQSTMKHSDVQLCERWIENPYYQYFCGEEFFQHRLPFDRTSLTRWRQRVGKERLQTLVQQALRPDE
jgi:transposase, IS5 family